MNSAAATKPARHLLSRAIDGATSFCSFTVTDGGIRVSAYGTHTSYVSDETVSREEARLVWRAKMADGYAVAA